MADTLRHRGPDDAGVWSDGGGFLALGHRRLAVVDLSSEGHQPMTSGSGRYVVSFNGEVYNHRALRSELTRAGLRFRGHSDTEVLLAAVERWGLLGALPRLNGMFGFALWDRESRRLHLVRDRLGEKPLYYGSIGPAFVFGSELKALRAHRAFAGEIDREALVLYLRHNCVPAPRSIYRGVKKLPPGTVLTVAPGRGVPVPVPYWSLREMAEQGLEHRFTGYPREAMEALDELLHQAVGMRMEADVPLGAFLSGGIDSSTVVALMQAQASRPVRTFTIGNTHAAFDEAREARAVASRLGTDHTELYVTPADAMAVVPDLPTIYDEPFADSSQIPTVLVSRLARKDVTVSLSGDGGDELFGGYNRHLWAEAIHRKVGSFPGTLRRGVARLLTLLSQETWEAVLGRVEPVLPMSARARVVGDKVYKVAEVLRADDDDGVYRALASHWKDPGTLVGVAEPERDGEMPAVPPGLEGLTERMMFLDTVTYLPDDILTKLDRASMSVALEGRVPLLDHRVVEFAWRLPLSMKVGNGQGKRILREVLHRYVPQAMVERPKTGFGVPIGSWLRGELRDWAEALLEPRRLRHEGFFDPEPIRQRWDEHLAARRDWQYDLWDVLMFQAWLDQERPSVRPGGRHAQTTRPTVY